MQGVEDEAGGFVVHLAGGEQSNDLHEGDLDGIGIFKYGKFEGDGLVAGAGRVEADMLVTPAFVEVAETVAALRGGSALGAVDFDVLAARNVIWIT